MIRYITGEMKTMTVVTISTMMKTMTIMPVGRALRTSRRA